MGRREIRIAGFGGQGVVLSGQILGQAACIHDKEFATMTQSYGPEARGGYCTAEVVISDEPIGYPYVVNPEIVVLLSREAYAKYGHDASEETLMIIDPDMVKPEPGQNSTLLSIPAMQMAKEMGRVVVANVIMLGFLAAVSNLVTAEALLKSILASVPKGTEELNTKAFDLGYKYGLEYERRSESRDG